MRQAFLLALALTVPLFAAAAPASAAVAQPRPAFWESAPLTGRGEAASFRVERMRGRTFVTAISTPAPDCGRLFGLYSNASGAPLRVRLRRGGHFRGRRRKPSRDNVIDLG